MRNLFLVLVCALLVSAQTRPAPTPAQGVANSLRGINRKVLDMAKDFPEELSAQKPYKDKATTVALFQKSVDDVTAALAGVPETQFAKTLAPWLSVIEHSGEHYGQLVV